jgi:hypothetical protein
LLFIFLLRSYDKEIKRTQQAPAATLSSTPPTTRGGASKR